MEKLTDALPAQWTSRCGGRAWVSRFSSVTSHACQKERPWRDHSSRVQAPCPMPCTEKPSCASAPARCLPRNPNAPVTSAMRSRMGLHSHEGIKSARLPIQGSEQVEDPAGDQAGRDPRRPGDPLAQGGARVGKEVDLGGEGIQLVVDEEARALDGVEVLLELVGVLAQVVAVERGGGSGELAVSPWKNDRIARRPPRTRP